MSKLDELIQQYCPNGAKYIELGEILDYIQPTKYIVNSTDYSDSYNLPVLTAGASFILGYTNENNNVFMASKLEPTIIFDDFTTSFHWVDFEFKIKSSAMKILVLSKNSECNFRFVYHSMNVINYSPVEHSRQWIQTYSKFKIALPPLEIQNEIVRILDQFTELNDVLNSELLARKKQYEYYRNSLLNFEDLVNHLLKGMLQQHCPIGVEYKKVKDVYTRIKGTSITAKLMKEIEKSDGKVRVFAGGKTVVNTNEVDIPNANIIRVPAVLVQSRGLIDFIYYDEPFTFKNEMWAYTSKNTINIKFLYYLFKNNTKQFREIASVRGSMPQISINITEDYLIPLPPNEIQEEIVRILDTFSEYSFLLNNEIETRQKQFEYYRNKLLAFKEFPHDSI